jgi:predicted DNA binding protein
MQAFIAGCDAVERTLLLSWSGERDGIETLLFRVEGDREPYLAALCTTDSVLDYEISSAGNDFYVYVHSEVRETDLRVRTAFRKTNVLPIPPVEFGSDGGMHFAIVGAPNDLRTVLDGLPAEVRIEIDAVSASAGSLAIVEGVLTDRQRETLRIAVDIGYYEVPRTASIEDVAERLGCASSTASVHLRKGEARLIETALGRKAHG